MKSKLLLLLLFSSFGHLYAQTKHTISGYIREKGSQEQLIGVSVYQPGTTNSTSSNTYGFYSITLPASQDSISLVFTYIGYRPEVRKFHLNRSIELNVELYPSTVLKEVEVVSERVQRVSESAQMSTIEVPISQIKDVPALLGEKDVMKVLQLMPGVQSGSEGNSGIYVRGGGPDQNLIILDDATVYNASHLFGFFSLFNGDALKSVELTKGGFPARYGGRLSSVIELNMKDGNKEEFHGEGGIGILASRFMLEGPLKKGTSSFLVSGRRTYADVLARPFMPKNDRPGYYFYDLNTKLNYDFGRKNKLYLSGYFGEDKFSYKYNSEDKGSSEKTGFDWGNATATLRWNHLFNDRLFANTSLIFSRYQFGIYTEEKDGDDVYSMRYSSGIRDYGVKFDLDYLPNPQHAVRAGFLSTAHRFSPSAFVLKDSDANQFEQRVNNIDVIESAVYVEDTYRPHPKVRLNGGFRLSHFYVDGKQYLNPEPRLSGSYNLKDDLALKASFSQMNQYVHLLSNTGIGLPTDLWVPTTKQVAPQQSKQVALGMAKDFSEKDLALTVEGYYKKSDNIIGYKEGASFLLLDDPESADEVSWENNITKGQAWSYGVEFLLQKKIGRFSGWAGYTLSWTQLQFDSLNFGKKYYARYDRRHDISMVGIYKLSEGITLSGTWVYGTGNAFTMPMGTYSASPNTPSQYPASAGYYNYGVTDYGERNAQRMAAYHRLDFGIQFHKKKAWGERTWDISVYNAYNRRNPFFYYIDETSTWNGNTNTYDSESKLKQITLFPIIPSVSYGFKF